MAKRTAAKKPRFKPKAGISPQRLAMLWMQMVEEDEQGGGVEEDEGLNAGSTTVTPGMIAFSEALEKAFASQAVTMRFLVEAMGCVDPSTASELHATLEEYAVQQEVVAPGPNGGIGVFELELFAIPLMGAVAAIEEVFADPNAIHALTLSLRGSGVVEAQSSVALLGGPLPPQAFVELHPQALHRLVKKTATWLSNPSLSSQKDKIDADLRALADTWRVPSTAAGTLGVRFVLGVRQRLVEVADGEVFRPPYDSLDAEAYEAEDDAPLEAALDHYAQMCATIVDNHPISALPPVLWEDLRGVLCHAIMDLSLAVYDSVSGPAAAPASALPSRRAFVCALQEDGASFVEVDGAGRFLGSFFLPALLLMADNAEFFADMQEEHTLTFVDDAALLPKPSLAS